MTLPASGVISLADVNAELGLTTTATISLNDASVRGLFGVASGVISMTNGYGKSNYRYGSPSGTFTYTGPGSGYVQIWVDNGQPYERFQIYLAYNSGGNVANVVGYDGYLDAAGNYYQYTVVTGDYYWYPSPQTNTFFFYQGGYLVNYIGAVDITSYG